MKIPIFSIILLIYLICLFCNKKRKHSFFVCLVGVTCALSINNISGYFIEFKGRELECADITLLLCAICAIFSGIRCKKRSIWILAALLLSGVVSILLELCLPVKAQIVDYSSNWDNYLFGNQELTLPAVSYQSIVMFGKGMCFMLVAISVQAGFNKSEFKIIKKYVYIFTKFHLVFVLLEFLTKYLFHTNILIELRCSILGAGRATNIDFQSRGSGFALFGLTRESSHLANVLFWFLSIVFLFKDVKKELKWVILSIALLFLSLAFSSIMFLGCLFIVSLILLYGHGHKKLSRRILICLVIFAVAIIAIPSYLSDRVKGLIFDLKYLSQNRIIAQEDITSTKIRFFGMIRTFQAFLYRPLLGLGWGTAYCNSGVVSALSNIGLIGFLLWNIFFIEELRVDGKQHLRYRIMLYLSIILLPNILFGDIGMLYSPAIWIVIYAISQSRKEYFSGNGCRVKKVRN